MTINQNFIDAHQTALPAHTAENLCSGGNLANIVHNGQIYTLRITRAGKLILTK